MNPIRRELLNGLFVLVVASLLSAAFAAFQLKFDLQLWVWIVIGVAIATGFYVMFELTLGFMSSTEGREKEWLKRVGNPARLERLTGIAEHIKTMSPGSDYTSMYYYGSQGGAELPAGTEAETQAFRQNLGTFLEGVKQGKIREYKRIICFDHDVLANDPELRSGVLRVGEGPGTIERTMGEHCRLMMKTKGCSLYVAPAIVRSIVVFFGAEKVAVTVETAEPGTGGRLTPGAIFFCDPPNGDIIEQFRQMERETERRMVAVREIRFPEEEPTAAAAAH